MEARWPEPPDERGIGEGLALPGMAER
jgi:hypothetical protein